MDNDESRTTDLLYWRFQADPTGVGAELGYQGDTYDDRRWGEVRAPVDFETCHPALDTYEGVGWYRHRLSAPSAWSGRRVALRLAGVNARATVWVNGLVVGHCTDPFLPFEFEIQPYLRFGTENTIAVCVDNSRRTGEVPGMQRGWRNYGGLLREVTLAVTDLCWLPELGCVATPTPTGGRLSIAGGVSNGRQQTVAAKLSAEVMASDGQVLAALIGATCPVGAGGEASLAITDDLAGVEAWSPRTPNLYTVRVTLWADDVAVAQRTVHVGFRKIEVRDGRLWLNGEPIFLTGFNRHEDSPTHNMRPDPALARRDLAAMKAAGANFVRLCHYPHHPQELDLCDELGLLAMGEIPLYWWDGLAEGPEASAAKLAAAKRQLEHMVRRDLNHPSVIFWSVSNETKENRPEVVAGNDELVRLAKTLDPTRLAVHVSDHWQWALQPKGSPDDVPADAPSLFEADDVICVNAYPSAAALTYTGSAATSSTYDFSASTRFWRQRLAALHERYPTKPILVTEFGSVSFRGAADGPFGEETHAKIIECELAGMDGPYVCGATVWCWADHAWPPATFAFCSHLATSPYGVVTRDRRRKQAFWTTRLLFRSIQAMEEEVARHELGPTGREIYMVRPNLRDIPEAPVPDGYRIRAMRPDEGGLWTDIWRDADPWTKVGPELFDAEFGDDLPALQWRSYIVEDERGVAVATITSWYNRTYKGQDYGQIHWVATRQAHWGRGIGKAMLRHALREMAQWHDRAFLGTQTKRIPAIKLYLDFGFVPDLDHDGAREAWQEVLDNLDHPALRAADLGRLGEP